VACVEMLWRVAFEMHVWWWVRSVSPSYVTSPPASFPRVGITSQSPRRGPWTLEVGRALGYRRMRAWAAHSRFKSVSSYYCSTKQRPACSAVHI
jgi:hypothetical protein